MIECKYCDNEIDPKYGLDICAECDGEDSRPAPGSAWIPAKERLPQHAKWVLIVVDNSSRDLPPSVGLGWRQWNSPTTERGWWETNQGLLKEELITHWMPTPPMPNEAVEPQKQP